MGSSFVSICRLKDLIKQLEDILKALEALPMHFSSPEDPRGLLDTLFLNAAHIISTDHTTNLLILCPANAIPSYIKARVILAAESYTHASDMCFCKKK